MTHVNWLPWQLQQVHAMGELYFFQKVCNFCKNRFFFYISTYRSTQNIFAIAITNSPFKTAATEDHEMEDENNLSLDLLTQVLFPSFYLEIEK